MKPKAFIWPAMIIGMLVINVGIVAFTMVAANKGEGASVARGYDERALRWDEHRREMAKSNALGWSCLAQLDRPARDAPIGTLRIALTIGDVEPVEAAPLMIQLFHSGHPTERVTINLTTDSSGRATSSVAAPRPGYYSLRIESPATADRAAYIHEVEILAAEPEGKATQP